MAFAQQLRRLTLAVLAGSAIAIGALSASVTIATLTPAVAQISEDAQIALEQYGAWRPHPRFGQVWVPTDVPPDWRPYTYGHWVYTDEWGWYWVSDDVEADWGWVVYHYGRWAFERGLGWFWVAGDEWAPAWVDWRYGEEYAGWAPLPPDELIESYVAEPAYWVFVPVRFIAAPRLRPYFVPVYRRSVILRETHTVNRTFLVRGARLAVNPGISPAFIARASGAPISTYRVRPRVFASTQGVSGAVQVRREELRGARGGRPPGPGGPGRRPGGDAARPGAISVQRTTTVIPPSSAATAPQPLGKSEPGRLGTHPPRAAQGIAPSTAPQQPSSPPAPPPGPPRQAPAVQQQAPASASPPPPGPPPTAGAPPPPPAPPPSANAPATTAPVQREERREERRERGAPGGPPGGPPPPQPNVVRPIPPQVSPPPQPNVVRPIPPQASPPQPPPPQDQRRAPPPQQEQRRIPPQPQPQQAAPPAPPTVRQPPPPAARPPPPPPPAARPAQPPPPAAKKPPPKPGEKPDEKK